MTFNPQEHVTNLHGKDYLEVKWRIVWFRDVHPAGRIETDVVFHDPVLVKATIFSADKCLATGYGTAKLQGVAKSRPYEGAETAAIGRALAHAGFGTQFTGEDEGDNLADSPVERKPAPRKTAQVTDEAAKGNGSGAKDYSTVATKEGELYSGLSLPVLVNHYNGIEKHLKTVKNLTDDERQEYELKRDAAKFYIDQKKA